MVMVMVVVVMMTMIYSLRDHFFSHFSQVLLNNIDPSVCGYSARFRAHRTIKSSKRKTELVQNLSVGHSPGGGGGWYDQKNRVGLCGPPTKTLILFMTKICDFLCPIYHPTKKLIPHLRPDP